MRFLTKALAGLAILGLTAGSAFAQTPVAPKPATTTAAPAAPATPAAKPPVTRAAAVVQPVPAGLTCSDAIVWVNTSSHKFRTPGQRLYGATKRGKYVCQKDAVAEGDKPVK